MAASPVPRLDGAAIQIKNLLYVFAGYGTIDYVSSLCFFFLRLIVKSEASYLFFMLQSSFLSW